MNRRFTIHPDARPEVIETRGELAALSVYALVDQNRSYKVYAPVTTTDDGQVVVLYSKATSFFDD